ncbi:MAG: hypothetical protein JWM28_4060 [Chitinophagaceae bacterium]|nr:hypothetical protein [Chitinophagaceae bacterium]
MIQFTTTILQFAEQGEKTGWTYIQVPVDIAQQLKPGNKKSFRVKGKLDNYTIQKIALLPMGGGDFIMALNATIRKGIRKGKGARLKVQLEIDKAKLTICPELIECLQDEPVAIDNFKKMPNSHQHYYSKWVESAKTEATKAKRIASTVTAMVRGMDFGEMLRAARKENEQLGRL